MSEFVSPALGLPAGPSPPPLPNPGDLYYNTVLLKAQYWDGAQWVSVPGTGGGGSCLPTRFAEDVNVGDDYRPKTRLGEDVNVGDDYRPKTKLGEDVNVDDAYRATSTQRWAEDVNAEDAVKTVKAANLVETVNVDDAYRPKTKLSEDVNTLDDVRSVTRLGDDVNVNDLSRVQAATVEIGASGTADTNPAGDTWIDQASAGTNHGTETTMLAKGKATVGSDERQAFLEIDFTAITGFTAQAATPFTLRITCLNSNALLAVTLTWTATTNATRLFTESTVTWTTPPTAGTALTSGTISVPTGAATVQEISLTQAQVNTCIGKWVMFKFTTATAVLPDTITINTREHATAKWNYDLKLTRGT